MDNGKERFFKVEEEVKKRRGIVNRAISIQNETSSMDSLSSRKYQTVTPSLFKRWKSIKKEPFNNEVEKGDMHTPLDDIILLESFDEIHEDETLSITVCKEMIHRDLIDLMKSNSGNVHLLYDIENLKITASNIENVFEKSTQFERNVAFLWTIFLRRFDLTDFFIRSKVDINFYEPKQGFTALHLSGFSGCVHCTQLLIEQGADVNALRGSFTPLHCAAFGNSPQAAKLLLKAGAKIAGVETNSENSSCNESVLHSAVRAKALECIQLFIEENVDMNSVAPGGTNALHLAADLGYTQCLKLLLESGKANINVQTSDRKYTALHYAAEGGFIECVRLLLKYGADASLRNHRQQTALHLASKICLECVEILLKEGGCDPNALDADNRTPLHVSVCKSESEFSSEIVETLIEWNSEVNKKDKYGYTPLHIAALNELSDCVETLIYHNADVTARTKGGTSALGIISRKTPAAVGIIHQNLDDAISLNDPEVSYKEVALKFNFKYLLQGCQNGEMNFLQTFIDEGQKGFLKHPLCEAFIYLKWQKIRKYYIARLLFCFVYVVLLSLYVLTALAYQCYNDSRPSFTTRILADYGDPELCPDKSFIGNFLRRHPAVIEAQWFTLVFFTILEILRKCYGFCGYTSFKKYISQFSNFVECFVVISVFVISFVYTGRTYPWQNHVGAFAVLFGWANLMVMIGHLPVFGSYVTMYTRVQKEFTKLFLAYFCLLIGFAICFCVIFPRSPQFTNPFVGLIKILVMMTGELDFNDLLENINGENAEAGILLQMSAFMTFVLFLLFITVILMNLLIGIAVHDIQGLQKTAGLSKLVDQTNLISHIELALFNKRLPKYVLHLLQWTALVSPFAYRVVISVKPLNPRECRLPQEVMRRALEMAKQRQTRRSRLHSRYSTKTGSDYQFRPSKFRERKRSLNNITCDGDMKSELAKLTEEIQRIKEMLENCHHRVLT